MATTLPICSSRARTPVAAAALLLAAAAAPAQDTTTLAPVTITGRMEPAATVGGWGDVPLSRAPFSASVLSSETLVERGVRRLADAVAVDPAVHQAYSAEGYWDILNVRGFVVDNRANYRRDGLPINAETRLPLDNKQRVEVLKGTSGLQSGISAPSGLVNLVVSRPLETPVRYGRLEWRQRGSLLGAVDLGERFGADRAFGLRVNAAAERLDPRVRDARGERHLLALAGDWRLAADALLEAEVEDSRHSQPSVPGFSMLGGVVPDANAIDPRINLNNQPWSQPTVFDNTTGSLRFTQRFAPRWRWTAHAATQRLRTDDRIAFPFGCSAENVFDRFCSDGTFDIYDFRSENERRRTDALQASVAGELHTGPVAHAVTAGVLRTRFRARFNEQAGVLPSGVGNISGTAVVPPDPTLFPPIPDRDERSTEAFVQDAARLGATTAWLGVRHARITRSAVGTAEFTRDLTLPSLAVSHELGGGPIVYAGWSQGVESPV
ncbi:MAG TPA: TonB-dependent receptor, partial [Albitalea sp.]